METKRDFQIWLMLAIVLLIGAFLRFFDLAGESLWIDEGQTVAYAVKSLPEIVKYCARDVHPPSYLFLIHFWTSLFGTSEAALRLPSAIFGLASVLLCFFLARRLFDNKTALLASLFLSISYMGIKFSQEARSYAMLLVVIILSYHALLLYLDKPSKGRAFYYMISIAIMLYVHYFALFIIISHQLYFLYFLSGRPERPGKRILSWVGINVGALILFAPWIHFLVKQIVAKMGGKGPGSWVMKPDMFVVYRTFIQLAGGKLPLLVFIFSLLVLIVTVLTRKFKKGKTIVSGKKYDEEKQSTRKPYVLISLWFACTIPLPIILSFVLKPIYVERYAIQFLPGFCIISAQMFMSMRPKMVRWFLVGLFLLTSSVSLYYYYTTLDKEQWREVAQFVKKYSKPDQVIVLSAPWIYEPFVYYFGKSQKPKIIQAFDFVDIRAETYPYDGVWLVQAHEFFSDPHGKVPESISKDHVLRRYRDFKKGVRIDPILVHFQSIRVSYYDRGDALKYFKRGKSFIPGLDDTLMSVKENVTEVALPEGGRALLFGPGTRLRYELKSDRDQEKGAISFWFAPKWGKEKAEKRMLLMAKGEEWNKHTIFLECAASGALRAIAFGDGKFSGMAETHPLNWSETKWHYIAISWEGTGIKLYIDGKQEAEGSFTAPFWADFKTLHLGCDYQNKYPAPGLYDDLALYHTPLHLSDVISLQKGDERQNPAPTFWFDFDRKGFRSVKDKDRFEGFATDKESFFLATMNVLKTGDLRVGRLFMKVKPQWNGDDGKQHVFITLAGDDWNRGSLYLEKAKNNSLQAIRWENGKVSCWAGLDVKNWKKDTWHTISFAWSDKSMTLVVDDGNPIKNTCSIPSNRGFKALYVGSDAKFGLSAEAFIRDLKFKK